MLSRLFPRNFTAKIVMVCFLGIHVPLITFAGFVLLGSGDRSDVMTLGILLGATLAGTAVTVTVLHALLTPLRLVSRRLTRWSPGDLDSDPLPEDYRDEVGRLMKVANRMLRNVDRQIADTTRAAETDPLTGLLNRRGLDRIWPDIAGAGALLLFDIDRFKAINDTFGHPAGDAVLRRVGQIVQRSVREGDVICRLGGDEFLLWLPDAGQAEAQALGERLRLAVADRKGGRESEGVALGPTISLGAVVTALPVDLPWLMDEADRALYRAKQAGRNRIVIGDEDPVGEKVA